MIHVREARLEDIGEVWALKQRMHISQMKKDPLYAKGVTQQTWLTMYADTIRDMTDSSVAYYLALDGDDPVGFAKLALGPLIGFDPSTARVEGVYVLDAYRRGTTLARLYRHVEGVVEKAGIKTLQGFVLTSNAEVATMWLKRGARVSAVFLEKSYGGDESTEAGQEGREGCGEYAAGGEGGLPGESVLRSAVESDSGDR